MPDPLRAPPQAVSGTVKLQRSAQGAWTLVFAGDWRAGRGADIAPVVREMADGAPLGPVEFDATAVTVWDTSFLLVLRKLEAAAGGAVSRDGLPDGLRRLMALAAQKEAPSGARRGAADESFLGGIGQATLNAVKEGGQMLAFTGETALAFWRLLRGRPGFRRSDLLLIVQDVGVKALPIVTLISVLVGMILAFVGAVQLRQFGVEIYVANLVGIAMLREMGALMTAIIMAGRTGAAFAAELASMQANEEVDSLSTLGFNPIDFLVLPRVIALVLMMPLLALYADILGILGGALIGTTLLGLDFAQYWAQTLRALNLTQLFIGLAKASVFGVIVALTGCQRGLFAGRSAAAVGLATTSAVVIAIVLIVVADGLFAVVLDILGL
ncbi:MAG: MlaE family ABC transporter permease [Alphaproteobacteria bacterium]